METPSNWNDFVNHDTDPYLTFNLKLRDPSPIFQEETQIVIKNVLYTCLYNLIPILHLTDNAFRNHHRNSPSKLKIDTRNKFLMHNHLATVIGMRLILGNLINKMTKTPEEIGAMDRDGFKSRSTFGGIVLENDITGVNLEVNYYNPFLITQLSQVEKNTVTNYINECGIIGSRITLLDNLEGLNSFIQNSTKLLTNLNDDVREVIKYSAPLYPYSN